MQTRLFIAAIAILLFCISPAAAQRDDTERALELFAAYHSAFVATQQHHGL